MVADIEELEEMYAPNFSPKLGPRHAPHRRGGSLSSALSLGRRQMQGSPKRHER